MIKRVAKEKFSVEREIDRLGRVVIPKDWRDRFQMSIGDMVVFLSTDEGILVKRVATTDETK